MGPAGDVDSAFFAKGSKLWVKASEVPWLKGSAEHIPWVKAKATGKTDGGVRVEVEVLDLVDTLAPIFDLSSFRVENGDAHREGVFVNESDCRTRSDDDSVVDNLVNSDILHEPSVLAIVGLRYSLDQIYTYSGQILIAVNPFKPLKHLYGPKMMSRYHDHFIGDLDPHVYAIAEQAFKLMQVDGKAQSILISGESGAGKTETAKLVMQYLAMRKSSSGSSFASSPVAAGAPGSPKKHSLSPYTPGLLQCRVDNSVEQQILQSNPLLEAFGNAKTVRNANSSRFGKFVQLKFDASGSVVGASVQTYLLERSRVVFVSPGERGYHIFYQLCTGAPEELRRRLHLEGLRAEDFDFLRPPNFEAGGHCTTVEGVDEAVELMQTREAMTHVGLTQEEQEGTLSMVTAILHLGNLCFDACEDGEGGDGSAVREGRSKDHLQWAAGLLGTDVCALEAALTTRKIVTPDGIITKGLHPSEAAKARDVLSKTLYVRLFTWIVGTVNTKIVPRGGLAVDETRSIGILDIYGFESFKSNCFEQLCINLANEHLQQHFNQQVLRHEQEEYASEGIEWDFIDFKDNQDVLDAIVGVRGKGLGGIMPILDECCRLPRTTPRDFAVSMQANLEGSQCISFDRRRPDQFNVRHYAGVVKYNTDQMIEKNKDYVILEHKALAESSGSELFKALFLLDKDEGKSKKKSSFQLKTVASHFTTQLRKLMADLCETNPHYIRCIKPNFGCQQNLFASGYVLEQLCYGGVMEAIRIAQCGFPGRREFASFLMRYDVLLDSKTRRVVEEGAYTEREAVGHVLGKLKLGEWQLGKTKVFMKEGVVPALENQRNAILEQAATLIQSAFRSHAVRMWVKQMKQAALVIQSYWRTLLAMRKLIALKRTSAAVKIQSVVRMLPHRREFQLTQANRRATVLQARFRGGQARKESLAAKLTLQRKAQRFAAVMIQKEWRRILAQKCFEKKKAESDYVRNLVEENTRMKEEIEKMSSTLRVQPQDKDIKFVPAVELTIQVNQDERKLQLLKDELSSTRASKSKLEVQLIEQIAQNDVLEKSKVDLVSSFEKKLAAKDELLVALEAKLSEEAIQGGMLRTAELALREQLHEATGRLQEAEAREKRLRELSAALESEKADTRSKMEEMSNALDTSLARQESLKVKMAMINEPSTPTKNDDVNGTPVRHATRSEMDRRLTVDRLSADDKNDYVTLVSSALECDGYVQKYTESAFWIALYLWERIGTNAIDMADLQVILENLPGQLLSSAMKAVTRDNGERLYYLLNTLISLSVLSKHKPPLQQMSWANPSVLQMSVFSANVGPDNTPFFAALRQLMYKTLQPARLVLEGSSVKKKGYTSAGGSAISSTVHSYLSDFEQIVQSLAASRLQTPILKAIVLDMLLISDAEIVNQLLLRRECCSTSSARVLDLTMRQVEKWCLAVCSEWGVTAGEVRSCLGRCLQACNFLLVHKSDIARAYRMGIPLGKLLSSKTDKLNIHQVYRLVAFHHDDWILGNRMSSDSMTLLHGLKKEIAASGTRGFSLDGGASPNHAAATWADDGEMDLLVDMDSEVGGLQSAVASEIRAICLSEQNTWLQCAQSKPVHLPENLEGNPRLSSLKELSLQVF